VTFYSDDYRATLGVALRARRQRSRADADRLAARLRDCMRQIERTPAIGRPMRIQADFPGALSFACGTWLIIYSVRGGDLYAHALEFVGF